MSTRNSHLTKHPIFYINPDSYHTKKWAYMALPIFLYLVPLSHDGSIWNQIFRNIWKRITFWLLHSYMPTNKERYARIPKFSQPSPFQHHSSGFSNSATIHMDSVMWAFPSVFSLSLCIWFSQNPASFVWHREYYHIFNNHITEHSEEFFPLMDLRLSLIWATRCSESEGSRRSGQILVNLVTNAWKLLLRM